MTLIVKGILPSVLVVTSGCYLMLNARYHTKLDNELQHSIVHNNHKTQTFS